MARLDIVCRMLELTKEEGGTCFSTLFPSYMSCNTGNVAQIKVLVHMAKTIFEIVRCEDLADVVQEHLPQKAMTMDEVMTTSKFWEHPRLYTSLKAIFSAQNLADSAWGHAGNFAQFWTLFQHFIERSVRYGRLLRCQTICTDIQLRLEGEHSHNRRKVTKECARIVLVLFSHIIGDGAVVDDAVIALLLELPCHVYADVSTTLANLMVRC